MTTKFLVLVTIVSGCATTERMSSWSGPDHHTGSMLAIHPAAATDEARPWFPSLAGEASLPSADRMRTELLANGHEALAVGVRVCVVRDGSVSRVDLVDSSGVESLDNSALHDIRAWKYEAFAGPSGAQTCRPLAIRYMP
jgi:TonB family protein